MSHKFLRAATFSAAWDVICKNVKNVKFMYFIIYIRPIFFFKETSRYSCLAMSVSIKFRYNKSGTATVRFCRVLVVIK